MIHSMTGFGAAERVWQSWTVRVETRSVNYGELKVSLRLPDMLRYCENDLTKLVQATLARGHVYVTVTCALAEQALDVLVDRDRLAAYVRLAKEAGASADVPVQVEVGSLLSLPGVIGSAAVPDDDREVLGAEVRAATRDSLAGLLAMREDEGRNLLGQVEGLCASIGEATRRVADGYAPCVAEHQQRMIARVQELLETVESKAEVNEEALAREIALLADRGDVSEELTRMDSHLAQFAQALDAGAPVGRKMDFLVQEMLREANTMGSKLPSVALVQEVIEIKSDVQKLREQVRNVE